FFFPHISRPRESHDPHLLSFAVSASPLSRRTLPAPPDARRRLLRERRRLLRCDGFVIRAAPSILRIFNCDGDILELKLREGGSPHAASNPSRFTNEGREGQSLQVPPCRNIYLMENSRELQRKLQRKLQTRIQSAILVY
ncbi:unnamed protein product, partial [Urochloa humidicola]